MQSACCGSVGGRGDHYPRTDLGDSQRSAGSYSQHSSQDGAVLGRFPKPAAPFRTPAGTPSLEPGLVNSLLRQQADRDDAMRRLNERVNSMEGAISALKDANSELMTGQKRLHDEMHELKMMQRSSSEDQERVSGRLERGQDEILSYIQQQKALASPAPRVAPWSAPPPQQQRIGAQSPKVRRRTPLVPSPLMRQPLKFSGSSCGRLTGGGSSSEEQPSPKQRHVLREIRHPLSNGNYAPSNASARPSYRPASPTPSYAPSCAPSVSASVYLARAAIKLDLFDDDDHDEIGVQYSQRPDQAAEQGAPRRALALSAAGREQQAAPRPGRIVVPLGAARPSAVLGATSLSHSGSKRHLAPTSWQSHQFARHKPGRQEALLALGGPAAYFEED